MYCLGYAVVLLPPEACKACNWIPSPGGKTIEKYPGEPPWLLLYQGGLG